MEDKKSAREHAFSFLGVSQDLAVVSIKWGVLHICCQISPGALQLGYCFVRRIRVYISMTLVLGTPQAPTLCIGLIRVR